MRNNTLGEDANWT